MNRQSSLILRIRDGQVDLLYLLGIYLVVNTENSYDFNGSRLVVALLMHCIEIYFLPALMGMSGIVLLGQHLRNVENWKKSFF